MALAVEVASRVNCMKVHVGAILLYDGRIRAVGYNGTLPGYEDCFAGGCDRCRDEKIPGGEDLDRCICVHAEENALASAARFGIPIDHSVCYVTYEPCIGCTKLLIQAGIARVVYLKEYVYEKDQGADRNLIRQSLRDHQEQRRQRGEDFTSFEQYRPMSAESESLADEWNKRLAKMKLEARAYCESIGKLIPKNVVPS